MVAIEGKSSYDLDRNAIIKGVHGRGTHKKGSRETSRRVHVGCCRVEEGSPFAQFIITETNSIF